jgi:hypothetical protein
MAGPTFRSATGGTVISPGGGSITRTVPSGNTTNDIDLMVVAVTGGTNETLTPPAGWTFVRRDDNGTTHSQWIYSRVCGSNEQSDTWSVSPNGDWSWNCVAYFGADTSIVVDAHNGQANASSATDTGPSITTNYANDVVLFCGSSAVKGHVSTEATGFTQRAHQDGGASITLATDISDKTFASAGATGSQSETWNLTGTNIGALVALAPAGSAVSAPFRIFKWKKRRFPKAPVRKKHGYPSWANLFNFRLLRVASKRFRRPTFPYDKRLIKRRSILSLFLFRQRRRTPPRPTRKRRPFVLTKALASFLSIFPFQARKKRLKYQRRPKKLWKIDFKPNDPGGLCPVFSVRERLSATLGLQEDLYAKSNTQEILAATSTTLERLSAVAMTSEYLTASAKIVPCCVD